MSVLCHKRTLEGSALAKKENPQTLPGAFCEMQIFYPAFGLFGLFQSLTLAQAHARTAAVFVDEFDTESHWWP
jgi:hypothetical protein